jgi:hypothetical protein
MAESFSSAFGTPVLLDNNDAVIYVLGTEFTASAVGSWTGIEWYVPATNDPVNHYILAYTDGTLTASKPITPIFGGGLQAFNWNTPLAITSGHTYEACVLTQRYTATTNFFATTDATTAHLTAPHASNGRLFVTSADTAHFPDSVSGNGATFHVSPVVSFTAETHSVTVAVSLGLAVVDTARKAGQARVAATLAFASSATDKAHRTSSVEATLGLTVDVHNRNPATAAGGSGGWYGLLGILQENRAEREYWRNQRPIACPNDGEPLLTGPHGELYCPFDGWRYSG